MVRNLFRMPGLPAEVLLKEYQIRNGIFFLGEFPNAFPIDIENFYGFN